MKPVSDFYSSIFILPLLVEMNYRKQQWIKKPKNIHFSRSAKSSEKL